MRIKLMPLGRVAELKPGERLLDALDEGGLPVLPTACRAANCGICTVIVRGDGAGLAPPGPGEQRYLAGLAAAGNQRLGCQIHAAGDSTEEEVVVDILAAQRRPAP
jgi:ferredoxin